MATWTEFAVINERGSQMRAQTLLAAAIAVTMLAVGCKPLSTADTGTLDDTAALQAQFDALTPGSTLTLERRVYHHSGTLTIRTPDVTIDGNGANVVATNDEASAVNVLGNGITVTNVTFSAPMTGQRWMGEQQHKLVVKGQHATIAKVTVSGSAGAGIYLSGAQNFTVRDVSIVGTRADGLHMTGGSAYGQVDNVRTDQTGDDGVSVVSYDHDQTPCHDITETNIAVAGNRWGRGITVVGGYNIAISNFSVANTSSAGLYVANEGSPFYTRSVEHVSISGGTVTGANYDPDIEQGAIMVNTGNPGRFVHDVAVTDVTVSGTGPQLNRNVAIVDETNGGENVVRAIALTRIHLTATEVAPFYSNVPPGSYTNTQWTLNGVPIVVTSI